MRNDALPSSERQKEKTPPGTQQNWPFKKDLANSLSRKMDWIYLHFQNCMLCTLTNIHKMVVFSRTAMTATQLPPGLPRLPLPGGALSRCANSFTNFLRHKKRIVLFFTNRKIKGRRRPQRRPPRPALCPGGRPHLWVRVPVFLRRGLLRGGVRRRRGGVGRDGVGVGEQKEGRQQQEEQAQVGFEVKWFPGKMSFY